MKSILLTLSVLVFGCAFRHVDVMTEFMIKGEVYDKDTRTPLKDVKVYFIDTGFDSVRSKAQYKNEIGKSDGLGRIDLTHRYFWGMEQGLLTKKPEETFTLELTKDNFKTLQLDFRAKELLSEGNKVHVSLNDIYLEPMR